LAPRNDKLTNHLAPLITTYGVSTREEHCSWDKDCIAPTGFKPHPPDTLLAARVVPPTDKNMMTTVPIVCSCVKEEIPKLGAVLHTLERELAAMTIAVSQPKKVPFTLHRGRAITNALLSMIVSAKEWSSSKILTTFVSISPRSKRSSLLNFGRVVFGSNRDLPVILA
jgi:hypothetical protein